MKHFLKQTIYLVPIILLVGTLLSLIIDFDYVLLGNILGYSIVSNLLFVYHFYYGPYCWLTRKAVIGLLIINIVDIIGVFIDYKIYSKIFEISICGIIITLALIFEIKKRMAHD